jgi:hypothetical protein
VRAESVAAVMYQWRALQCHITYHKVPSFPFHGLSLLFNNNKIMYSFLRSISSYGQCVLVLGTYFMKAKFVILPLFISRRKSARVCSVMVIILCQTGYRDLPVILDCIFV